jgi:hypothetical protein
MNPAHALIARSILSVMFVGGYGWIVVSVLQAGVLSPDVKEVLIFLFGALTTSVVTIVGFWFGSTQGSADKTAVLAQRDP